MSGQWITISAADKSGQFDAYMTLPETGKGPAVIAIQEIFGVNSGMREICENLSKAGYIAICPDLFWRQQPHIELSDKTEEEWQKAFDLYNGFDVDKGVDDIQATLNHAQTLDQLSGKVGAVGYCLGGLLAYLTSTRTNIDASIGFYGVGIQDKLDEAKAINTPLLLHIAEKDEFVPADAQAKIHEAFDHNPNITLFDYKNMDHAFARPDGIHHDAENAQLAQNRSLNFFKRHLG